MAETYIINGDLVVTEDGEILDCRPGVDRIALLASRLEDARAQRKLYEQEEAILQSALLREMQRAGFTKTVVNMDGVELVAAIRQQTYPVQHTDEFASEIQSMLPDITKEELVTIIHAARSFAPEALPEHFQELLARVTEHRPKKAYVDVSRPKRPSRLQRLAPSE